MVGGKPIPPKAKAFPANENCDRVITTIGVLITSVDTRLIFLGPQSTAIPASSSQQYSPRGVILEPLTWAALFGLRFSRECSQTFWCLHKYGARQQQPMQVIKHCNRGFPFQLWLSWIQGAASEALSLGVFMIQKKIPAHTVDAAFISLALISSVFS